MKSPFTGGHVTLKSRLETFSFRGESFTLECQYYQCDDTGREFTNAEVDDKMLNDIFAQYRERHDIPTPTELKDLRSKYNLSARVMSIIAGMGINQYGIYERGAQLPTITMGRRLRDLFSINSLISDVENAKNRLGKMYPSILNRITSTIVKDTTISIISPYYRDFYYYSMDTRNRILSIDKSKWVTR